MWSSDGLGSLNGELRRWRQEDWAEMTRFCAWGFAVTEGNAENTWLTDRVSGGPRLCQVGP